MFLWSSLLLINLLVFQFQTVYSTSVTLDKDNFHKEVKNGIAFVLFTNPSGNKSSELYMVWKALSFRFSDTRSVKIGDIDCADYEGSKSDNHQFCKSIMVIKLNILIVFHNPKVNRIHLFLTPWKA